LFDLNAETRTITCNLVEVKCYTQTGGLSGYAQLKETVASQLEQSEQVLRQHFDPQLYTPDRLDRSFKVAEFTKLLEFYLDRSERFALLDSDAADEARFLLRTLAAGYEMAFTRSGLIFDFDKNGADAPEVESGVEFHRIGADMVRALLDAAGRRPIFAAAAAEAPAGPPTPEASTSVFKKAAAFLPKPRDRSVARQQVTLLPEDAEQIAEPSLPRQDQPPPSEPSWDLAVKPKKVASGSDVASASVAAEDFAGPLTSPEVPRRPAALQAMPEAGRTTTEPVAYDVILGCTEESPQYGLLGEVAGRRIALDLNQTQTISLFGVQDGGKSYTLGTIAEMATMPIDSINLLPSPLATVIFHFSPTQDYRPEFTAMSRANADPLAVDSLRRRFGVVPQALDDVVLLVPADKVEQRRAEYAELSVCPLSFASSELKIGHWQFLMGAVGSQAVYIRQLKALMRSLRDDLTLTNLRSAVDQSSLPDHLKDLARMRLGLAAQYIDDASELSRLLRPGRLVIVDLRDEFIEKDEALGLFVVLMQLFADVKHKDSRFNKLIVFDEAHKYIDSPDLVSGLVDVVRQMRHKGTSVLVASQDPPSVPVSLIELSTQIILHRFNSPAWLKHLQKANAALSDLTPEKMASLGQGEAYIWSSKASDDAFCKGAVKVKCRPRVTQHGGGTRTAVE